MLLLSLTLAAVLRQTEPAPEAPPAEAPPAAESAPAATEPATAPAAVVRTPRVPTTEELMRQIDRIRKLPPSEVGEAVDEFRRKFPNADNLTAPGAGAGINVPRTLDSKLAALSEAEQVKYFARVAFNNIIAGDARGLVLQSGFPFSLEDRRVEMPDELFKEWLKNLRSKRTDLLTLYGIEVLTPAEMEKKYGRPPARLNALPWRNPRTMIAIGNLSGHATVAILHSANSTSAWQMVGYHD